MLVGGCERAGAYDGLVVDGRRDVRVIPVLRVGAIMMRVAGASTAAAAAVGVTGLPVGV
jgi:hypothetical protein